MSGRGTGRGGEPASRTSPPGGAAGRSPDDVAIVLVTGPDRPTLRALSRTLVEERLIACANVVDGVTSIFRWKGAIEEDAEALAILKTTARRLEAVERRVRELHPYDVPEVLALPADRGSEPYLAWVRDCVRDVTEARGGP